MNLPRILLVVAVLAAPAALRAQSDSVPPLPTVQAAEKPSATSRFQRMALPAVLGSGLGLVAGAYIGAEPFYDATGCCGGGDDPGLTSALGGAVIGSVLGSSLGAYVTRTKDEPVSFTRAFLGATVGLASGVFFGIAGAELADQDPSGLLVGFSVGQGMTTAAFAVPYP